MAANQPTWLGPVVGAGAVLLLLAGVVLAQNETAITTDDPAGVVGDTAPIGGVPAPAAGDAPAKDPAKCPRHAHDQAAAGDAAAPDAPGGA